MLLQRIINIVKPVQEDHSMNHQKYLFYHKAAFFIKQPLTKVVLTKPLAFPCSKLIWETYLFIVTALKILFTQ